MNHILHDSHLTGRSIDWQGAVDCLTKNSINLMNAIKELLKEAEVAAATTKGKI